MRHVIALSAHFGIAAKLVLVLATAMVPFVAPVARAQSSGGSGISWETDLRAAHAKAQQEGKLLLLHFYSDNCVWCDRLEAGAFKVPQVADAIHSGYVPVKIHAGQNPSLAKTFRVNSFPTDVIVTIEGTALAHGTSPQAADRYIGMLAQHRAAAPQQTAPQQTAPVAPVQPAEVMVAQTTAPPTATANPYAMPAGAAAQVAQSAPPQSVAAPQPSTTAQTGTPAIPAAHRNPVAGPIDSIPAGEDSASAIPAAPKLAMDGYCPVSLLEQDQWIEGNPQFGVIHLGQLYLFVDQAAVTKFLADPEPYTPVLNGIDVVRFFEEKRIVQGKRDFGVRDPDHNRMFFFADEAARAHFEEDYKRYTAAAITVTRQAVAEANPRR
jgi:protein disulfide-isomerase